VRALASKAVMVAVALGAGMAMAGKPGQVSSPDPCAENFKPPSGTVSGRRQTLVPERKVQKVLEQEKHELKCRPKETDARCQDRARMKWSKRAGERELSVWLVSPDVGVHVIFRVDGKRLARRFKDHDGAAAFMKGALASGKDVVLESSKRATDPTRRTARVTIRRLGEGKIAPYLKVSYTWDTGGGEMAGKVKEIHEVMTKMRRAILQFEALGAGRATLLFQCPAPKAKP
jgi:hypothetical protein